ncbi:MAG: hypothetical protein HY238_04305 [Acidobacteria bacterium]|nr:hypothetical protein [Acidobacteriota bacterium]
MAAEIVRIFRDHGPREARAKCRLAFLIEEWGFTRLRADLEFRLRRDLESAGDDVRRPYHSDHLGITAQKQSGLVSVGFSVPAGRLDPSQMAELAYLSDTYAGGEIRFTVGQDAILPNVPAEQVEALLREPLLREFSPHASPFTRRMVACTGTDFCNLAQIETKRLAVDLSRALAPFLRRKVAITNAGRPLAGAGGPRSTICHSGTALRLT